LETGNTFCLIQKQGTKTCEKGFIYIYIYMDGWTFLLMW